MKKKRASAYISKTIGLVLATFLIFFNYCPQMLAIRKLPDYISLEESDDMAFLDNISNPFTFEKEESEYAGTILGERLGDAKHSNRPDSIKIKLFGIITLKEINIFLLKSSNVIPGGHSIGVTLYTKGVLVVGTSEVFTPNGMVQSPAASAGIQPSDVILKANGVYVEDAEHLSEICAESSGVVELLVDRHGSEITVTVFPEKDYQNGEYRMGMWVRDSTAGIGTLSVYDPSTGSFGALGHPITDLDTGTMLAVGEGKVYPSKITEILPSTEGVPGELRGVFGSADSSIGNLLKNTQFGIYGKLESFLSNPLYPEGVQIATPDEARTGTAYLLTTIDPTGIQAFECEIIKVTPQSQPAPKGMVLQITDKDLITRTGGIVQGMSGSPVIQNGKLIGVITHVFVNDPLKGYCIHAVWMQHQMDY